MGAPLDSDPLDSEARGACPSPFHRATDFWTLRSAARKAARGCRHSTPAMAFLAELETEVLALQAELRHGTYAPGPFHTFRIRDPKPRTISAAPFRDRVVHHALCMAMEPVFEAEADPDSYACRPGKGTRAAIWRIQQLSRRWPWFAKLDVHHCFETTHLPTLKAMLGARFVDPPLLAVLDRVLDRGAHAPDRGLPIGNLTSQHLANFLLAPLDQTARALGVGGWVRYMDDMFVFGPDRQTVARHADAVSHVLATRLHQQEKSTARRVAPVHSGVPALGMRIWPQRKRLDAARRKRLHAHLRRLERAQCPHTSPDEVERLTRSAASIIGWAEQADTRGLRQAFFRDS